MNAKTGKRLQNTRSVRVDGRRIRNSRKALGLTQEELAEGVGFSDRLIRKAEKGGPLALKSVLLIGEYFTSCGQETALSQLVLSEQDQQAIETISKWFEAVGGKLDVRAVPKLFAPDCVICSEGICLATTDLVRAWQQIWNLFSSIESTVNYRFHTNQWLVAGWTSHRTFALSPGRGSVAKPGTDNGQQVLTGVTSIRIQQSQITEYYEFSNVREYVPEYSKLVSI